MTVTYIRVGICPTSPWRVGALTESRNTLATATDHLGNAVVPASSLAGAFRQHVGEELAADMMGKLVQDAGTDNQEVHFASKLWFLGAVLRGGEKRKRTATAIDRTRKAARNGGSHGVEEVYDTKEIKLYLRYDGDPSKVLEKLSSWPVTIGGGISTGLGQAKIAEIRYRTLDLTNEDDLCARLSLDKAGSDGMDQLLCESESKTYRVDSPEQPDALRADVQVNKLNVPVKATTDDAGPDDCRFHGTRWKGILRSRVEYIGRSLGLKVCGADERTWHGCGECAVCEVFGSGKTGVGRWAFGFTELGDVKVDNRYRNAIDRFTGGAANEKLYPERTVSSERAEFVIRQIRPLEDQHAWVVKALLLAMKDLQDGIIGIGSRSSTGLGGVKFTSLEIGEDLARFVKVSLVEDAPKITRADLEADGRFLKEEKDV